MMKKVYTFVILSFLFLGITNITSAQQWKEYLVPKKDGAYTLHDYQKAFKAYSENYKLTHQKNSLDDPENKEFGVPGYSQFKRWEWYWEPRVNQKTGEFPKESAWEVWNNFKTKGNVKSVGGTWTSRGAANLDAYDSGASQESGTGRLNCAHFDPSDNNHYWVGSPAGGLWETTNNGTNWTCLTDANPVIGVSDIAIPPDYDVTTNPTIYIASGDRDAGDDPSIGILKTTDGGANWTQTGLDFHDKSGVKIGRIIINPDDKNIMWAATSLGMYRSADQGANWTFVQGGNFIDMELLPGSTGTGAGTLISTTYGWSPKVYRSTDGGLTWTNTWSAPTADEFRCDVAVTPAASNTVFIITADGTNDMAFHGLYKSTDGGITFSQVYAGTTNNLYGWYASNAMSAGGQGWYDATLAVSNTTANVIYIGGVNAYVSTNGGSSFTICNGWRGGLGCDVVHADHHNAYFRPSDNRLFDCNDGGFYYSDNVTSGGSSNWTSKIDGLVTGQLYDIGIAQTTANEIVAGYQDNGTKLLDPSSSATYWSIVKDGDGMCCAIDPTTQNTQWGTYAGTQVDRTTNEWGSSSSIRAGGSAAWAGPVEADPRNANTVYVGSAYVERYVGTTKTNLSASLDATNYLRALDVYNDGTNLVIWTASLTNCWKSNTSGGSYTAIAGLPGDAVTDIAIDEDNYNHVYVCFGGYDNNNVYETTNGGTSWTDISAGLPAVPCGAIVINENNTTKNEVYVGTDAGIYVRLGNAPWQLFTTGMPLVSITDLEIYYGGTPLIYAATYGRAVWSSDCYDAPTLDASISYVSIPATEYCSLGNIAPTVTLANIGTTSLTSATISYTIDGGAAVTQNWSGTLAQGATTNIVFPSIALSYGAHDFVATVSNPNGGTDSNADNDTKTKTFSVWNNDAPYTQTFDNFTPAIGYNGTSIVLEECWTNETGESSLDWSVNQGATPSGSTGPLNDHTGNGRYLYTEVSGISVATPVQLYSPTFDLTNYTNNQISFWYSMNGVNCGSLSIDLYYGGTWYNGISAVWDGTTATSVSGPKGANWLQVTADISAADGNNDVQIRISSTTGTAYDGDIAIDDFNITGVSACTQPATQASNILFSGITNNSITVNWTQGSGNADLVVAREASAVNQDPTSGTTYTADNSVPFTGSEIGTGNYVVYDGSAGATTVTGLTAGTTYHFAIYTYNSVDHCYNVTELTGNTTTLGPPSITTDVTSAITGSSATSGGNVTSDNGSAVTARGVCWNTLGSATIADSKTTDGSGTGAFVSSITGLSATTTYYVRAYATNGYGTSYGNEEVFTTLCGIFSLPFTEDFASGTLPSCWENIDNDGGGQIWEFNNPGGVTVNTTTSANGFAILDSDNYGNGNSQDADLITPTLDLTGFTGVNLSFEHYFRSYAGSSAELFYSIDGGNTWTPIQSWTADTGNPETFSQAIAAVDGQSNVKFKWNYTGSYGWYWAIDDINITGTVAGTAPTVTTQAVTSISCTTATGNGNITNLGIPNPTAHGVCWNTTGTPTTSDSFTDEGGTSSTGAFTSTMTGLSANTTYYVRAYATNTAGTSYGAEVNFTTDPNLAVSVSIAAGANPICDGTSVTFTATPTNGGTPSYQWKLNGTNVGSNSSTYTNATLANGDDVTCVMTSDLSCTTGNPATSNTVTMTVNPILPVSVNIAAGTNPVCDGTSVTFTATPTNGGGTPAYQWKLNGTNVGTNSATYTNATLANGDIVTCVLTSSETCTSGNPATSNDVTMTVNPQPVAPTSVSASPTLVSSGGTSTLSYSGGSGDTFEWYTGSCGGTGIGSGNNLDVTNITSTTTYYGRWENGCGVSSCQQVTVTVSGASTYTISGTVKYDDASTTAVNGETIELYDGATLKDTKTTDASGAYTFTNVADGTYTVKPAGNLAWGGATAMDVTLYKKEISAPGTILTGLKWTSGDINGDASLTTSDLTPDLQRIVTIINSFTVGDWAYTDGAVTVSGANITKNLSAICYGDANTSRFGAKSLQTIAIENNDVIYVENGDYFELQINLQNNISDVSSVTLNIPFDDTKFEITDVTMENNNSNMYYNVSNGVLIIAYSNLNTSNYVVGDKFLKITGHVNNISQETNFSNNIMGEFGDYNNNVLNSIIFSMPTFSPKANSISEIDEQIFIYPNPANNFLNIINAENSTVEILNMLGSKVLISRNIDKNKSRINTHNLSAGTYILKINKDNKVIMKKFTIIK